MRNYQDNKNILRPFPGTKDDLLKKLKQRYLPLSPSYSAPDYSGDPNFHLDRPIDESEVRAALAKIRRNTTPGRDRITNKILTNLDHDCHIAHTIHEWLLLGKGSHTAGMKDG